MAIRFRLSFRGDLLSTRRMKRSFSFGCVVALFCSFAVASVNAEGARENKRLQQGKITKNEAQHLVLKKFPGATINKCELKTGKDGANWSVDLIKAGSKEVTHLQVDGRSGQITP